MITGGIQSISSGCSTRHRPSEPRQTCAQADPFANVLDLSWHCSGLDAQCCKHSARWADEYASLTLDSCCERVSRCPHAQGILFLFS